MLSRAPALLACAALLAACGAPTQAVPRPAPGFTLSDLSGQRRALADYRGRVVFVNFWATWCIPCRTEIPDLQHEFQAHPDGLVVLGVDWKESRDDALTLAREIGVSYPMLLDTDGRVHDLYHVGGLPQTFVLDRLGRIVASRTGAASRETMEQEYQRAASTG